MSSRTVVDCDRCKTEIPPKLQTRVAVYVGDFMDPAGSRDYDQEYVDLCPACASSALLSLLSRIPTYDYERNKSLLKGLSGDPAELRKAFGDTPATKQVAGSV